MKTKWLPVLLGGGKVPVSKRDDVLRNGVLRMRDETKQELACPTCERCTTPREPSEAQEQVGKVGATFRAIGDWVSELLPKKSGLSSGLMFSVCVLMAGCSGIRSDATSTVDVPPYIELLGGGVRALNYTSWYIHTFAITGPKGSGIGGGGPNVWPMDKGSNEPSGGAKETCCMSFPLEWQPDLKLTVRWLVEKKRPDGKVFGYWYKAEGVQIAQYDGKMAGAVWGIFLPGDRVRLMITDGNHNGGNNANNRPADDDPYVVQGTIDDEWNRLYPPAHD
ncbi:DUF3304 domain-containing protein [Paraburkholderia phytofirmans]|uniref:DUF3304 domain-containing protein n=1 Tax=Paraburkholderia phytofirmans TaxID=261302 RepID=A0ABW9BLB7_9BURK